jgi:hypothetical protein
LFDRWIGEEFAPEPAQIERDVVAVDAEIHVAHIVVRSHLPGLLRE